jgi:hypothetical protein
MQTRSDGWKRKGKKLTVGARVPVVGGKVAVLATMRTAFGGFPETTECTTACSVRR